MTTLDLAQRRLEALLARGLRSPHTPQAWAFLDALGDLRRDDRLAALGYAVHRLGWIGHPAPEAWLTRVALCGLGRALSGEDRRPERAPLALARALSRLALVLSASDRFGRAWEVVRVGPRGAEIQATSHIGSGAYALSIADADVEPVRYTTPALQLWWRPEGAYWACTGTCGRAKGGMFAQDADGRFDTMPLTAALLGWDHAHARARVAALRAWHAEARSAPAAHDAAHDAAQHRRVEA